MKEYKWLWPLIMIPVGFFLGVFGKKIFTATLFIVGTFVTFFVVSLIFYTTFLSS